MVRELEPRLNVDVAVCRCAWTVTQMALPFPAIGVMPSNFRRVLERVTKDSCSGAGNRAAAVFEEDDGIDARFRNKLTDFQMSGYDRGHMVGLARACNFKEDPTFCTALTISAIPLCAC